MGKYKPTYDEEKIRRQSTAANESGRSPQECVAIEESAQRAVAESEQ